MMGGEVREEKRRGDSKDLVHPKIRTYTLFTCVHASIKAMAGLYIVRVSHPGRSLESTKCMSLRYLGMKLPGLATRGHLGW